MEDRGADESSPIPEDRGVSITDVLPFCEQLEKFIQYIGNVRDLNFFTFEYPHVLKNRLDANVLELKATLAEVKEALVNAERLKTQRKLIKIEKIGVKKILKRMRDDEIREMESVISEYDKPMFSRWENMKTTQDPEALEVMLTDIRGKQLALENLNVLVTRKINQIQVFQPINTGEANDEKNSSGSREKTIIPLPFPSFCNPISPIPPPPPPLPPPPQVSIQGPVSHLPKRSHTQRLTIQRRRRLERRDENMERRPPIVEDLSSAPLRLSDLPNNLSRNLYPTILSPTSNSSHGVILDDSVASARNGQNEVNILNINDNNNMNDNSDEARGLRTEFQSEMRTVLQALFGDLRSAPTLLVTDSTSSDVAEAENESNANREIELYALKKT